ncbi:ABC transporter permease [Streptomyces radicis]|uniref:ABC transporter permease n=2 Tax=Streptomyces radicis TaxID=1750517 RepID=A0A3A9VTP4_9ACTN|nr:ABC transporter permease [Streptomyces radicis]RKN14776.1 ABC transporter permease [Streptomyces radicis]
MFVEPGVQLLFFGLLGTFGPYDTEFYVVGNAVRLMATSALFGTASVIVAERSQGTLTALLATPTPAAETFYGRALLQGVSGILTGVFTLGLGVVVFDLDLSYDAWGWALLAMIVTAVSLSGLGLLLANISLLGTDPNLVLNIVFYSLMVITGANFPLSDLPAPLAMLGEITPMTHGLEAVRRALDGDSAGVLPLLGQELAVGAFFGLVAVVALRRAEIRARRTGTLELM